MMVLGLDAPLSESRKRAGPEPALFFASLPVFGRTRAPAPIAG
jgi:hypothetical protein